MHSWVVCDAIASGGNRTLRSVRFVPASFGFETRLVGPAVLAGGILAWLWPIGIGGHDARRRRCDAVFPGIDGVLPGVAPGGTAAGLERPCGVTDFPGLAESQMGVFYPVHLILYRWLNTETAYVVSLVVHTLWGGLGAYWAARRMEISRMGSALAAFCWTTCGFFLVHLAHPWGYTTGCWMPWAWGLGCSLLGCRRGRQAGLSVSAGAGAGSPALAGAFSTGVSDSVRAGVDGGLGGGRAIASSARTSRSERGSICRPVQSARGRGCSAGAGLGVSRWRPFSSSRPRGWRNWPAPQRRIRISIRLCVAAVSSRQLRCPGVVPSFAAVAAAWSGIRFTPCPRNIWRTWAWFPCSSRA